MTTCIFRSMYTKRVNSGLKKAPVTIFTVENLSNVQTKSVSSLIVVFFAIEVVAGHVLCFTIKNLNRRMYTEHA